MIVLASNSITRANILKSVGLEFIQRGCDFDEDSLSQNVPEHFVYYATIGKMNRYLELYDLDIPVVAADTVVTCKGKILRKAKDKDDAREILKLQSGSQVSKISCLVYLSKGKQLIDLSSTEYFFREFENDKLKDYLNGDEWIGKAGACMVEGFCKDYIQEVKGYESTAMGLCVEKLLPFLD